MARNSFVINLSDFITNARQSILDSKTSLRAKKIQTFNQRVVSEGLSLDAQLTFWQTQKTMDENSQFPTPDFITEAGDQVASLSKQKRAKDYRDIYQRKLGEIEANKDNYDNLKSWLEGQLANAIDGDLKSEMQTNLNDTNTKISDAIKDAVTTQITRGQNDRSLTVLADAQKTIDSKIGEAMASGKSDVEQYWRGKLTVVKQSVNTIKAEDAINDFRVGQIQGLNSIQLLNKLNTSVSKYAVDNIPIYVDTDSGSVKYDNINAFLVSSRDSFLSDTSDKGFFGKIQKENEDFIDRVANTINQIPMGTLDSIKNAIDGLKSRPELAPYASQIENLKVGLLKRGVDKNVEKIVSHFTADLNFSSAASQIQKLAQRYGIDQSEIMDSLVNAMADKRQAIIDNIIGTASQIQGDHPGMSWSDAVGQAETYFRGGIISPNQAVEQSIHSLALQAANPKNAKGAGNKIPNATSSSGASQWQVLSPSDMKKYKPSEMINVGGHVFLRVGVTPHGGVKDTSATNNNATTTAGTAPIVEQTTATATPPATTTGTNAPVQNPATTAGSTPATTAGSTPATTPTNAGNENLVGHEPVNPAPPQGAYYIPNPSFLSNFSGNETVKVGTRIYVKPDVYASRHIAKPSDLAKYKPTEYFKMGSVTFLKSGVKKR